MHLQKVQKFLESPIIVVFLSEDRWQMVNKTVMSFKELLVRICLYKSELLHR